MKGFSQMTSRFPRFWYALWKTWCILWGCKHPGRTRAGCLILPGLYLATDVLSDVLKGLGVPWMWWLPVAVVVILALVLTVQIRRSLHRDDSEKSRSVDVPVGCLIAGYLVFFPVAEWVHALLDSTYPFDWELVLHISGFLLRIFIIVFLAVFVYQFLRQFESSGT